MAQVYVYFNMELKVYAPIIVHKNVPGESMVKYTTKVVKNKTIKNGSSF
jgi:hypothetical protein